MVTLAPNPLASAMSTATETMHPFEAAGLGLAPFSYVGMTEKVYSACPGHSQPAGTCDYCGQGIKYCCEIRSADGRSFIVGCDCVRKLNRSDNRMLTAMGRDIATRERAKRDAERPAKWQSQCEERDRELQSQRDKNGGLTDSEVREAEQQRLKIANQEKFTAKNSWLLEVLANHSGDFCSSMSDKISRGEIGELPTRCVDILRDIYGKSFGRSGSKKYNAACDEFDARVTTL